MMEPYLTHVQHALGALPGPPFAISRNDTYVIEASNNVMSVRFLIENSIEPIISVTILDNSGKVFDVSLLEELIDPERLDRKRRRLRELTDIEEGKWLSFETKDEYARIWSGVSAGTITVTDAAGQAQDLAGLNRDTSNLNGTVSKLPDVSGVLGDELDVMSAANAAGQAVAKDIGTFADYKEAKARDGQKAAALLGETDLAVEYKAEGDLWGEGGDDRVMLHMAGGALLGGLGAGSVVGAMSGAAGAGASAYLAPALNDVADQFGDPGTAGHAVGNIIANLLATAAGGAVGGGVGAATASNVDAYNRQLHPDEKQRIKQLAGNNAVEEARLTAAACAMTNCYAEYPVGSVEYQQLKQIADYGASSALASERNLLSQQTGMFGYSTSGAFSDANVDAAKQFNNTYQITTRGVGAGEAVLGALGIAGAVASAPLSCTTGVGCIANAVVAGTSTDALIAGSKQAVFGQSESTYLNQALMGLGMSPAAAGILEVAFGIGAGAVAGGVVNALTDQAAALNKLGAASYQEFPLMDFKQLHN